MTASSAARRLATAPAGKKQLRPRNEQLASMPVNYLLCRVTNRHSIDPESYTLNPVPGGYQITWQCPVCTLEISISFDRWGFRDHSKSPGRKYPPGYLIEEGGRLTDAEKAALFMGLMKGKQ